jgi:isopentenyldiphosphate isomerase
MNVVNWKLQKYYELLWNLVWTVGWCPTEQKIQEYENHCKTHINYYSGLILQQKKDKDTLENEIGHKDEKTLNNLNNEINRLFTQIQTITNEKNAI